MGRLVRKIVGVDRETVNEAFSEFMNDERLNINQIRFVRLMIDYIAANGNIEDNTAFDGGTVPKCGSIPVLFKDNMGTAKRILDTAVQIRKNSEETA